MLFFPLKEFLRSAFATLTLALSLFVFAFLKDDFFVSALQDTSVKESYYLYSASSSAKECSSLGLLDLPFVEGKSVSLIFESETAAGEYVRGLVENTGAHLQKAEYMEGAVSYYLFSQWLGESVAVSGLPVNLHIAVCGRRVSVGSPIIFGGY